MIINKIDIFFKLNFFGKKFWEVLYFDIFELWKFGDYKIFIFLKLMVYVLEIFFLKDDIDGS